MIVATISGQDTVQARLLLLSEKARAAAEKAIKREAIGLVGYIKSSKLSDQVLRVRTGRLRRSITARFQDEGKSSFAAFVGTNVKYARTHELGFNGSVTVKSHQRKITQAFGKKLAAPVVVDVRAHAMQVRLPARPFLRPASEEKMPKIQENIRKAVLEALR